MILKVILHAILLFTFTASDFQYGGDLIVTEVLEVKEEDDIREITWNRTDIFEKYLKDSSNIVSEAFKINSFYYSSVEFWFLIYTQFDSDQVLIHDKQNLSIVYKILDFKNYHKRNKSTRSLHSLQQSISNDKIASFKKVLMELEKNPFLENGETHEIYHSIENAGINLPENRSERSNFFKELRTNIRSQTGQRNFIRTGIVKSLPYRKFIHDYFAIKSIPEELFAIPFLESSFNPIAGSRAGAAGVWQFMPLIASYYLPPRNKTTDYRFNIATSSVAAGFLLSENYRIMKSWDLAVTSYNSGTKHLLKTKRKIKKPDATLEDIINNSDSKHFGFASKNFYTEFLALVHALAYQEELFQDLHKSDRFNVNSDIRFFITKCGLTLSKSLSEDELDDVIYHNHHIKQFHKSLPRGFVLVSKLELPKAKFIEIPFKKVVKIKPKKWINEIRNQSCSTR